MEKVFENRRLLILLVDVWHVLLTGGIFLLALPAWVKYGDFSQQMIVWGIVYAILSTCVLIDKGDDSRTKAPLAYALALYVLLQPTAGLSFSVLLALGLFFGVRQWKTANTYPLTGVLFGFWAVSFWGAMGTSRIEDGDRLIAIFSPVAYTFVWEYIWFIVACGAITYALNAFVDRFEFEKRQQDVGNSERTETVPEKEEEKRRPKRDYSHLKGYVNPVTEVAKKIRESKQKSEEPKEESKTASQPEVKEGKKQEKNTTKKPITRKERKENPKQQKEIEEKRNNENFFRNPVPKKLKRKIKEIIIKLTR
ncbi:hypothetical protein IMZ31_20910 (plasmid) [Pontibacillus sp. ALD_SL1]|uniref:hypothetical protein n=1 Tax=Pontibacillus sp. ALD_SL1 TaxID=2777185 RepID=UPI001A9614DE|nr:hypothetical protein [Pontibacillus sp. ALD_SL1]QST03010.1 hypothetical protein IMZ31_20910 [Pontibacillus sp. ALD_SL1]